jgi:hypothetical protein
MVTAADVNFTATFDLGFHSIGISASNGRTTPATCSTAVLVRDTAPPDISHASANPALLWPPNNEMRLVQLQVHATDACGLTHSRIVSVTANQPISRHDWQVMENLSLLLRAKRLGNGKARVYSILVESTDQAGNATLRNVTVTVPHDQRPQTLRLRGPQRRPQSDRIRVEQRSHSNR